MGEVRHVPTERFDAGVAMARELHARQTRKHTDVSYVSHLLGVASLVMEHGGDEDQVIAALLHDAIEDQGGVGAEDEIRRRFGSRVANMVRDCSDADTLPKPPWDQRKQAYVAHLRTVHEDVLLVSLADKVHNARSLATDQDTLGDGHWSRFNAGSLRSGWYYGSLLAVFKERLGETPLVRELEIAVARLWPDGTPPDLPSEAADRPASGPTA